MIIRQLLLLFFIVHLSFSSELITLSPDEQDYLKIKKEIKICYRPTGLPLFDYKGTKEIGIQPDIVSLLQKKISIPFHTIPTKSWKECIDLTKENKVDIAAVIILSPNKLTHLTPSHKLFEGYVALATKIQETVVGDISTLKNKKIALCKKQVNLNSFVQHKLPGFEYVMVDTIEEGLSLVAKGRVYAYADDTYSLAYYILKRYSNELKIIEKVSSTPVSAALGILNDEPRLLSIINKAIDSTNEQEIQDIIHKWIAVRVEKGFDYILLYELVFVFLVILFVSFYWIRKLSKEVLKRKSAEIKLKNFNENLEKEISSKIEEIHYKDVMLLEKTKLAAMGEMLGSIAHQWRAPLSTLHINIEMLEEDYKEGKIDKIFLDQYIQKNSGIIQYMSKTIDDFQNFYKVDKEKRLFDVMKKIKFVSNLQLNQLEKNAIEFTKEGESFIVLGYASEFQQVILNLISNAKDALLEKKIKNPYIKIVLWSNKDKGYIQITDNAGGIDEQTKDKIFEPYFTTKEHSGGMGLGLYMSKMIIEKNMQGTLSISNQDEGSEVLIMLQREEDE